MATWCPDWLNAIRTVRQDRRALGAEFPCKWVTVPGINYVDYDSRGLVEPYRSRMKDVIENARRQAQFLIVSAHVGPNWGSPSPAMQALAHDLLDRGAGHYWGHSNHTPQGIELYHGKVILYSTGDFIDDYAWILMSAMISPSYSCSIFIGRRCGRYDCPRSPLHAVKFALREERRAHGWNSVCGPHVGASGRTSNFTTGME